MTGQIIRIPAPAAACDDIVGCQGLPPASEYVPGTWWQCDHCHGVWVVVQGVQYNEAYRAWRTRTAENEDGREAVVR